MAEREIISIVTASVGLVGVAGVLIKFTIDSVFKNLQDQINGLKADAQHREKEIISLRNIVDGWMSKYYQLQGEHSALQANHEALQREFDLTKR